MISFTQTLLLLEIVAVPLKSVKEPDLGCDPSIRRQSQDGNQTYLILNDFGKMRPPVLFTWPFQDRISARQLGVFNLFFNS